MQLDVPTPIATYLEAQATNRTELFDLCFASDALVRDEGHVYSGVELIKAWQRAAKAKYRYSAEALEVSREGSDYRVTIRLTGEFPGSPLNVEYFFRLADDKIASLEIR